MRILITNWRLQNLAGSEINVLEFAKLWSEWGHRVDIYSPSIGEPWLSEFRKLNQTLVTLVAKPTSLYDVAWVHHGNMLKDLSFDAKHIVSYSMSSWLFEERPWLNAHLFLANSEETKQRWLSMQPNISILPNSAPVEFFNAAKIKATNVIKNVAIVSNHMPPELKAAADILRSEHDFNVVHYGERGIINRIDSELLSRFDAIVSIGKTVQYALAMNLAVFCYDHFGGPGWITESNVFHCSQYNFSGRCCKTQFSAKQLVEMLLSKPKNCYLHDYAKQHFSLDKNMRNIFDAHFIDITKSR